MPVVLVTNNPRLGRGESIVKTLSREAFERLLSDRRSNMESRAALSGAGRHFCFFFDDAPLAVLLAGRELARAGFRLFHHPLYGNIRPARQPYRSLAFVDDAGRGAADDWSIKLMEQAADAYQRVPKFDAETAPQALLDDCALLDHELMRGPLAEAGWPCENSDF